MVDMIVRKCSYSIITMVMIRLVPYRDLPFLTAPRFLRCGNEVLGKKLTLLVEVVGCTLGK